VTILNRLSHDLNAYTLTFEDHILDEIRESFNQNIKQFISNPKNKKYFAGGKTFFKTVGNYRLFSYGKYPLLWFCNNNQETYQIYKNFFDNLNIQNEVKKLVDFDEKIIMYSGFLVIGNQANIDLWHYDYYPNSNAYTLITPLFNPEAIHGGLQYQLSNEQVEIYKYSLKEAIIFGDKFMHSTEPYEYTDKFRILVSITFGTDKPEYWKLIKKTAVATHLTISHYFKLPCGHTKGRCICLIKKSLPNLYKKLNKLGGDFLYK
jgi:hypothetical protein